MALEERYYSCARVAVERGGLTLDVPSITLEPLVSSDFAQREVSGDVSYLVAATTDGWSEFDALYTNQDADTGDPYRRRYPRSVLSFVDFGDAS